MLSHSAGARQAFQRAVASRTPWILLLTMLMVLVEGVLIARKVNQIPLLRDSADARWIRASGPTNLSAQARLPKAAVFSRTVNAADLGHRLVVKIAAFGSATVYLNGKKIEYLAPTEKKIVSRKFDIGRLLRKGSNVVLVVVENTTGPPVFLLDAGHTELSSGVGWRSTTDGKKWHPVALATDMPCSHVGDSLPTPLEAMAQRAVSLVLMFITGVALAIGASKIGSSRVSDIALRLFRFLALAALVALFWHNFELVPRYSGMDVAAHYQYLDLVLSKDILPLAGQGWQTFEPPLAYLIVARLIQFVHYFDPAISALVLARAITMIVMLTMTYFAGRAVESVMRGHGIAQWFGVAITMAMPVAIYMAHAFGNELYFALMGTLAFYWIGCHMDVDQSVGWRDATALGVFCGLAALAKVTALIVCAVVAVVLLRWQLRNGKKWRPCAKVLGIYLFWIALISGWWYLRNYLVFGKPFAGGWQMNWWQYPGYRTVGSLFKFGVALTHPIFAGIVDFWDGVYSTFWGDGQLSGIIRLSEAVHWNFLAMQSLYILAIPLSMFIVMGLGRVLFRRYGRDQSMILEMSGAALILLLGAMFYLYATVPIYSSSKGSYLLVLVPGISILAASGVELLDRGPGTRALIAGFLAVWVGSVYSAFVILGP